LRFRADPVAAPGGYDAGMAAFAARLRLPLRVQDVLLAAFVTLFQIRGTRLVAPGRSWRGSPNRTMWVMRCWP
jgi:hypothetical protein